MHATLQPSVRLSVCLSVRLLNRPSVTLCFLLLLPSHMTSTPAHPSTTYTTMYTDLGVFFFFFQELTTSSRSLNFYINERAAYLNPQRIYLSISLQIVKNNNDEGLTIEDKVIGPPSPITALFDDVSISIGETCLGIYLRTVGLKHLTLATVHYLLSLFFCQIDPIRISVS